MPTAENDKPDSASPAAPSCPVDHKTRETWLAQARQGQSSQPKHDRDAFKPSTSAKPPNQNDGRGILSFLWSSSSSPPPTQPKITNSRLSTQRQVSSIPRASSAQSSASYPAQANLPDPTQSSHANPSTTSPSPSLNNETIEPHTSATGNWIYPSEEMFFNAMKRKSYNPRTADMATIIPIHNAVNEKTWQNILAWERAADPTSRKTCGGPKLLSFSGDSQKLTPRARWNTLLGYEKPFDRHDWVVDRCGKKIDYVIDFYAGKRRQGDRIGPSFYLDVRPKLNSLEGVRMRAFRFLGLSSWPNE